MKNSNTAETIAVLPLDNRPANYLFIQQIAQIAGVDVLLPPHEILGDLRHAAGREGVRRWINRLPKVDCLIVSIDAIAYGGLVQSRENKTTFDDAKERLKVLLEWQENNTNTPVLAHSVVMRHGATVTDNESALRHIQLQRYCRLVDEAEYFDSEYLRQELETLVQEIPPKVLLQYQKTRQRNLEINQLVLQYTAQGVFDYALLTQEDCAQWDIHRAEQKVLLTDTERLEITDKVSLEPGTDEAALLLLARSLNCKSTFGVHWSSVNDAENIPQFEDRTFTETLALQLGVIHSSEQKENADFELFINAPLPYSRGEIEESNIQNRQKVLSDFVAKIKGAISQGCHVALCDVAFANGADDQLMELLDKEKVLGKLTAFAAWNTAANTLGTVLAQCQAMANADCSNTLLNQQFLLERYLDDWIYQTRLRPKMQQLSKTLPLDKIQEQTERELHGYAKLLAQRHFGKKLHHFSVRFPWQRLFEVEVKSTFEGVVD